MNLNPRHATDEERRRQDRQVMLLENALRSPNANDKQIALLERAIQEKKDALAARAAVPA